MKKILFIAGVHGDEVVGKWLAHHYPKGSNEHYQWETIIGNPRAAQKRVRYIDEDLNRAFNQPLATTYERQRAVELTPLIASYDVVFDIHQTMNLGMRDCIFVNELNHKTRELLKTLSARYVIVDSHPKYSGHFATSVAKTGITLQYLRRRYFTDEVQLLRKDFVNIVHQRDTGVKKTFLKIYKAVTKKSRYTNLGLKNFKKLYDFQKLALGIKEKGIFYPIFIGAYTDFFCFIAIEKRNGGRRKIIKG